MDRQICRLFVVLGMMGIMTSSEAEQVPASPPTVSPAVQMAPAQQETKKRKPMSFNPTQVDILIVAHKIGCEVGMSETAQAIVLKESVAGKIGFGVGDSHEDVGKRSYGVAQVKIAAARYVLHNHQELKAEYFGDRPLRSVVDEEIIVLLMTDNEANIVIAMRYLLSMIDMHGTWAKGLIAYNWGTANVDKVNYPHRFPYVVDLNDLIKTDIRPFNERMNLTC